MFVSSTKVVTVFLKSALICFSGHCYPALVGADTPVGTFHLERRNVLSPGYGGVVIEFKESDNYVWAIHRVWLGNPREQRLSRIQSSDPSVRHITHGCINVMPNVFEKLLENCCTGYKLEITDK